MGFEQLDSTWETRSSVCAASSGRVCVCVLSARFHEGALWHQAHIYRISPSKLSLIHTHMLYHLDSSHSQLSTLVSLTPRFAISSSPIRRPPTAWVALARGGAASRHRPTPNRRLVVPRPWPLRVIRIVLKRQLALGLEGAKPRLAPRLSLEQMVEVIRQRHVLKLVPPWSDVL